MKNALVACVTSWILQLFCIPGAVNLAQTRTFRENECNCCTDCALQVHLSCQRCKFVWGCPGFCVPWPG